MMTIFVAKKEKEWGMMIGCIMSLRQSIHLNEREEVMADTVDGAAVPEKKEKKGKEKKERGPLRQDHLGKLYFKS